MLLERIVVMYCSNCMHIIMLVVIAPDVNCVNWLSPTVGTAREYIVEVLFLYILLDTAPLK
jgi:hypothetical protein